MATDKKQLADLMNLMSGDKKHDPSAYSTLGVLSVLYDRVLHYDASNPRSEDRDRFILSKGHGPLALYAILALKGFFPKSELEKFMQWDGILGGHPDRNLVPGVEASTDSSPKRSPRSGSRRSSWSRTTTRRRCCSEP